MIRSRVVAVRRLEVEDFPSVVREAVSVAMAELLAREERMAWAALVLTAPERRHTLEWVAAPFRFDERGAWPRSIACSWDRG